MKTIKIVAEKNVVNCAKCGMANTYLYLSDFSYGEFLLSYTDKKYAYTNLIADKWYKPFIRTVDELLEKYRPNLSKDASREIIAQTYGITCDDIDGYSLDFSNRTSYLCDHCASMQFEHVLAEPVSLAEIKVPLITHDAWEKLSEQEQFQHIKETLKERGFI